MACSGQYEWDSCQRKSRWQCKGASSSIAERLVLQHNSVIWGLSSPRCWTGYIVMVGAATGLVHCKIFFYPVTLILVFWCSCKGIRSAIKIDCHSQLQSIVSHICWLMSYYDIRGEMSLSNFTVLPSPQKSCSTCCIFHTKTKNPVVRENHLQQQMGKTVDASPDFPALESPRDISLANLHYWVKHLGWQDEVMCRYWPRWPDPVFHTLTGWGMQTTLCQFV